MLPDQCVLVSASVGEEETAVSEMLGDEPELQEPCLNSYARLRLTRATLLTMMNMVLMWSYVSHQKCQK
eukprot:768752-Pyramimonas_sp.AAC.1